MIKSGISQIGGKFRLRKELLEFTPYHEFFLSMFAGSSIYELNKPRCRYECFNDKDSEIINYLLMIREHPKEFDKMKKGIFGLVSQEICNRIKNGNLKPKNSLERAYFFYFLNKLTFGGVQEKGYGGLNQNRAIPKSTFHKKDIEKIKTRYRGITLPTVCKEESVNKAKSNFRDIVPKAGIDILLKQSVSYKGINPKTTRPYSNNDCGLLTPIDPNAIKRLRYVNLTCYDFRKVYKLFYRAFYKKKELTKECLVYADEPYPGTEKYYQLKFGDKDHLDLIEICLDTPFNFMLSTGGNCEIYLDALNEAGWIIKEVYTRYSTSANTQKLTKEYICMNYDIKKLPRMTMEVEQKNLEQFIEVEE